jgi:cytochrome P450
VAVDQRSLDAQLQALFALDPDLIRNPYPLLDRLREETPVAWHGADMVIVFEHALGKDIYRDSATFPVASSRKRQFPERLSLLSDEEIGFVEEMHAIEATMMVHKNGEDHRRVRSAGARAFTPRRVAGLGVAIERITNRLLDELVAEEGTCDLMRLCFRLPLLVIAEMMDAPPEDADRLREWGDLRASLGVNPIPPEVARTAHRGLVEYREYVLELVDAHRRSPNPATLIGDLLDATAADQLTLDELAGMYMLMLFAGHETTSNTIGNGMVAFFRNPEQWELLRSDHSLAGSAVEESLRFDPTAHFSSRLVAENTEIGGVPVRAGVTVMISKGAANRDPKVFGEPGVFDVTRSPNDHITFGHGVHFCLGAPISRLEGKIAFETIVRRFPDVELAIDPDELEWWPRFNHRGVRSLPVRLGRDRG